MFRVYKLFIFICLFGLFCFLLQAASNACFALKSDSQKKIRIIGDYALLNYKTGINTFEGHVQVDQGTTHVSADRIQTVNNTHHEIKEVTAFGLQKLAHYWTLPNLGEHEIHAHAKIIKFFPQNSNARLEQDAIVVQGNNSFRGETILYDMNEQTVTVPPSKNGNKAVIIYDPDSK